MRSILKKSICLMVAIMCMAVLYSSQVKAVSFSLEISGEGIQYANGNYYCTKMVPVGGTMNVKAELVTKNDIHTPDTPTGETNREDVTSECQWSSSKENIATVENGVITGVSEVVTEITVTSDYGSKKFYVGVGEEVEVGIGENMVIVQKENKKTIFRGRTLQLDIEGVESLSHLTNKDVEWSSSDEKIATVDSNGVVTAVSDGNATIKAVYATDTKTYESTYEITVETIDNIEPPLKIENDTYNFSSNKKELTLDVGSSDIVEITAKLKEGLDTIQVVKMEKDYWNVEWKIEDETIAKCVPEKGIENNIYGATQTAGRAKIEGLKEGTTQLLVKVKVSADRVEEIKIPVTVKVKKDNEKNKEDNPKETNDNTKAPTNIPQAGSSYAVITTLGLISTFLVIVAFRKYKK